MTFDLDLLLTFEAVVTVCGDLKNLTVCDGTYSQR
jgi:hypothetical protein